MKLMTYDEFKNGVQIEAEELQENIVNASEIEGDDYFNQAIRVDFSPEEDTYIKEAYTDYLKNEATSVADVMEVLSQMDSEDPILTISKKGSFDRMEAGMDHDDNGETFDYWDYTEMPEQALNKAAITSIYQSDNLYDRWCVDAELDGETFTKCFNEAKTAEPEE